MRLLKRKWWRRELNSSQHNHSLFSHSWHRLCSPIRLSQDQHLPCSKVRLLQCAKTKASLYQHHRCRQIKYSLIQLPRCAKISLHQQGKCSNLQPNRGQLLPYKTQRQILYFRPLPVSTAQHRTSLRSCLTHQSCPSSLLNNSIPSFKHTWRSWWRTTSLTSIALIAWRIGQRTW